MDMRKFYEFKEYVDKVAMLDDVEKYALSMGNVQMHNKEDFGRAKVLLGFLVSNQKFDFAPEMREEIDEKIKELVKDGRR